MQAGFGAELGWAECLVGLFHEQNVAGRDDALNLGEHALAFIVGQVLQPAGGVTRTRA